MFKKIKLIFKSARQYKKYAIITPLFMIGEAIMECGLPFIMSILVDIIGRIGEEGEEGMAVFTQNFFYHNQNFHIGNGINVSILGLIITLIIASLISLTCGIFGARFGAKAAVGFATNLRHDLYEKLETFSFANIDKFSIPSLVTRMTTDVSQVQMAYSMLIRIVIRAPLMMIFSAVMAFLSGGPLAFIFVIIIPILGFALFLIVRKAMGIFIRLFKKYDALNASVQENVTGMRVVKSYVREEFEKNKFNTASDGMTGEFIHAEKLVALNNPVMNTTIHLSNILIIGIGASIIAANSRVEGGVIVFDSLSIGQLSSLLTYGIQILMSIMMISMIMVMLVMSLEAIRRIAEVLNEEPTIKNPENPVMEVSDGSIIFDNVCFKYSETAERDTLENININIKSGQFIGIIGSTGSGKTSLVNLISRLYDVSEGSVSIGGVDVRDYDLTTLRDNVAVILQKNVLFSGTILDNLRWGKKDASLEEVIKACQIAQAEEFINQFPDRYNTRIEQGGSNVSGGQKQRLCIARAILKSPKILILDDSTSAVDTKTDRLIRKALQEDIPHITKIVIAQRISSIEDADQIIVMNEGHIDQIGTHEELLRTNAIYQEVYNTQNAVGGDK